MAQSEKKDECTVIKLEPRLGDCDTVTTKDGTASVDTFLDKKRSERIKTETEEIRETQFQEMGRDRRKSLKQLGNLGGNRYSHPLYTEKDGLEKSGFVTHIGGDRMSEAVDENGLTESVKQLRHVTEGDRRKFEKESRDIWNATANIKGQPRTTTSQFMLWVMIFAQYMILTKSRWLKLFDTVMAKWNNGKSAVSFKSISTGTSYAFLKLLRNTDYAISALLYSPQKSSKIEIFGFHPCVIYIRREDLYTMIMKSKKKEGWDLLKRYCTEGDPIYNKHVASWVNKLVETPKPFTGVKEVTTDDVEIDDMNPTIVRQLVVALRDNMDDAELGRFMKQSAEPFGNLLQMIFAGVKTYGEIDIKMKLKF